MSNEEHYFENLLFHGQDMEGDLNKNTLSKEVQEAIETCAYYVLYSLFNGREDFDRRRIVIDKKWIPIPDNATNGEVLNAVFGDYMVYDIEVYIENNMLSSEWLNAPYKRGDAE